MYEKELPVYNGGYAAQVINVSGFAEGVYFVTLQTEKEVLSKKFVKQ